MGTPEEMVDTRSRRRASHHVEIDGAHCKGCLICVYVCNKLGGNVLEESEENTALGGVLPRVVGKCIGCRWCERFCPDFAIAVEEADEC